MIIGLSGYAGTGKDTVAKVLIDNHGYRRIAFADAIRDSLYVLNPIVREGFRVQGLVDSYGWDNAKVKNLELRRLLQVYGSEVGRERYGNGFWVNQALKGISNSLEKIVITDVRFPNEADAIKMYDKAQIWRVARPGVAPINSHISETAMDTYLCNHTIVNDSGKNDLEKTIELLLK
jgi:hypothetical protein